MRVTTVVILGAGLLIGGLLMAALVPADAQPAGGAAGVVAVTASDSPIDDIVEESLRHAQEADAAISDGRLPPPTPSTPESSAPITLNTPDSAAHDTPHEPTSGWRPPKHDMPPGVYFDETTLLLVGPRWVYEFQAVEGGGESTRSRGFPIQIGLLPKVAMGYIDGAHFVRWAKGDGWLPNDVAGPEHARRRTRLRRQNSALCVSPTRCLQYSTARAPDRSRSLLWDVMPPSLLSQSSRLGPLHISYGASPLPTGLPRNAVSFDISWMDARQAKHTWGTPRPTLGRVQMFAPRPVRHTVQQPPANRLKLGASTPTKARAGWPKVSPEQVRCTCIGEYCAPDDRESHVVAAQHIELTGLPWADKRWRCDRPNASRLWSLQPLGLKGSAVLEKGRAGMPQLRLPAPIAPAVMGRGVPSMLEVRDDALRVIWRFDAHTDGTLHALRAGAEKAVVLQPIR